MKRFNLLSLFMALVLVLFISGCGNKAPNGQPEAPPAGYEVQDSTGAVVKLSGQPRRIVSLTLGTDEILLGLVPVDRIAALTYLSDDPGICSAAEQANQVPVKIRDSAESVISLQPDLVIIADWMNPALAKSVRDAGIPVYVYKTPNTVAEVKQSVLEISRLVGEEAKGRQIVAGMEEELERVDAVVKTIPSDQRQTLVALSFMGAFGSKDSLFDDMCRYAGVVNGAAAVGLTKENTLSKEQIVGINPDVLLLPDWDYDGKRNIEQYRLQVQNDPALQTVKAIRHQRLVQVPDRYLYSVSQSIVYGVRDIAKAAYPQYFGGEM
ncbi:MAG: ABC transporter substrate-binding protein [Veillonellales bacterium]